jgi:hypothetical protein
MKNFIPVADEVGHLQNKKDVEAKLFQKVAEQGHYAGRTKPTGTRQGIYAATPNGTLLSSINTRNADAMLRMMEKALEKWESLSREERLFPEAPEEKPSGRFRWEWKYPEEGLILHQYSRDLPRSKGSIQGWRKNAWNQDFAWFRKKEARSFLSSDPKVGEVHPVPLPLVLRLVRFHLMDIVRGQTSPWKLSHIKKANLESSVLKREGDRVTLSLRGKSRSHAKGKWPVRGMKSAKEDADRGFDAELRGRAVYDLTKERFLSFELLATGSRWGGTQYNGRGDDLDPAPMGIFFRIAGSGGGERVAPAFIWGYRWK